MEVTVWSLLGNDASGHITFRVPPTYLIRDLLQLYCLEKGINVERHYALCGRGNDVLNPSKTLAEADIHNGEVLLLTRLGKNMQPFSFGSWWIVSFLAFIIGIVGISYVLYLFYMPITTHKSAVIIDAGSTHSQLFVFTWSAEDTRGTGQIELKHDCFMPGGVADFRTNLDQISDYFLPCLKEAESLIPISRRPKTPLVLGATAGMRLLRAYDPQGADMILSTIREVFSSRTKFMTTSTDVYIVSGQQEGISGWTALNYLLKTFQEEADPPVSALDLGGASVQVTTELTKSGNRWPTVNITIFNNTYRVYSKSFLCYGIGEALHRHEHFLFTAANESQQVVYNNPCLPKGSSSSIAKGDFSDPCVYSNLTKDYPLNGSYKGGKYLRRFYSKFHPNEFEQHYKDYEESSSNGTILYQLEGSSDMKECRRRVRALFDFELCRRTFLLGSCLNRQHMPPYKGELIGFSDIFLMLLPLLEVSQDSTLSEFKDAVFRTCRMNTSDIKKRHPNLSKEMLEDLCFDSMYVYTLLTDGLGITSERWNHILFQNKIHKQDVAWTMGLMVNRTSSLPPEKGHTRIDLTPFILLLLLFSSFLLTAGMAFYNTWQLKRQRYSYQRVNNKKNRWCCRSL